MVEGVVSKVCDKNHVFVYFYVLVVIIPSEMYRLVMNRKCIAWLIKNLGASP